MAADKFHADQNDEPDLPTSDWRNLSFQLSWLDGLAAGVSTGSASGLLENLRAARTKARLQRFACQSLQHRHAVLSDCPKNTLKLFGTLHVSLSMQA